MSEFKKEIAALDHARVRLAAVTPQLPPPLTDVAYVSSRAAPQAHAGPRVGSRTPWGSADHVEKVAEGIWRVDTPSHGGYKLDAAHNAAVPDYMRGKSGWYEEDEAWAIVATIFPLTFGEAARAQAKKTLRNWRPDAYERYYGVVLAPGESHMKDSRAFKTKHASDWIAVAAWGDWKEGVPKGMALVEAARGGRSSDGSIPRPTKQFLVPKEEYDRASSHGFVVDTARHEEVK